MDETRPQLPFRRRVLEFVAARQTGDRTGRYAYAPGRAEPTLYSSCYAAMARHLLGDLGRLPATERSAWISYLNAHQEDDGLFGDPAIAGQGWYAGDPLWCGRAHLTCHAVTALACLGGRAARPFAWLAPWRDRDRLIRWLGSRDWGARVAWTGNEILNVGTLLQYARDFHGDDSAGRATEALLDWLTTHRMDLSTGVWGALDPANPIQRSHAVQAAYHCWLLFFYDGLPIPHLERAIDTVLATQNPCGGFGWGVHNPSAPFVSSACEDIDSIDPLCRMGRRTPYRREDIAAALAQAADWVRSNQTADGGFAFLRDRPFEYGHRLLRAESGQGALFPTWFRLLSLALIDDALGRTGWQFVRCPGLQFGPAGDGA